MRKSDVSAQDLLARRWFSPFHHCKSGRHAAFREMASIFLVLSTFVSLSL
ncbi:hypothetical protein GQP67_001553 [Salmonella enterica]|nr:hypothetical protein [Salmonella enterica]